MPTLRSDAAPAIGPGRSAAPRAPAMAAPSAGRYMPHLDGLRCVAVLAVLLFHFEVPGIRGGYVGVDIFFVLSGFLITRIIVAGLQADAGFGFAAFYARRIMRILPALAATLAVTTLLALVTLTPAELAGYGRSLAAAAASLSNLLFWSESGYFDAASKTKPLLHTWSLGVEEQFYLVWPVFLALAYKLAGRAGVFGGILLAGVASFAANHLAVAAGSDGHASALFYLPQFRVFEFAAGAVACFAAERLRRSEGLQSWMMAAGLALILWSVLRLEPGVVFPYVNALAPCLGAVLVVLAPSAPGVGALLTNRVAVWLGRISYSLYLVHWPVVVFAEHWLPAMDRITRGALMAVATLCGALLLHHAVEARFRLPGGVRRPRAVAGVLLALLSLCGVGLAIAWSDGMTWRYRYFTPGALTTPAPAIVQEPTGSAATASTPQEDGTHAFRPLSAADVEAGKARRFEELHAACRIDVLADASRCHMQRPLQVLVFGNSHEPDAFNAFNHVYGGDDRVNLIGFGTLNDCAFELGADGPVSGRAVHDCAGRFRILASREFLDAIDVVVYSSHRGFERRSEKSWALLEWLKTRKPGLRIVAIGAYLQTTVDCAALYNRYRTHQACSRDAFVDYHNPAERAGTDVPQVQSLDYLYISKYRLLCGGDALEGCTTFARGEPVFYDRHHLSLGAAKLLGDRMADVYGEELAAIGFPPPPSTE